MRTIATSLRAATAALMLTGCATSAPPVATTSAPPTTPTQPVVANPVGVGLDMADMDQNVNPCDDFFQFSGGNWLRANPIPSYASSWGPRNLLNDRTQATLRQLLESAAANQGAAPGSNAQKVGDFYAAAMDTAAIERNGLTALKPELARIAALRDRAALPALLAHEQELQTGAFFHGGVDVDEKNTTRYVVLMYQGGLTLPDRDYYFKTDARSEKVKAAYRTYLATVFGLLGGTATEAQKQAATVEHIETRLAQASRTRVELRDPQANYNLLTLADAQKRYPILNPTRLLAEMHLTAAKEIIVGQPAFFDELDKVLRTEPLADIQTYLRWQLVRSVASTLPLAYGQASFQYQQAQTGAKQQLARWKRTLGATDAYLGEAFGQLYVDKAFPPEAKAKALEMVANIKASMAEHIQTNT